MIYHDWNAAHGLGLFWPSGESHKRAVEENGESVLFSTPLYDSAAIFSFIMTLYLFKSLRIKLQ